MLLLLLLILLLLNLLQRPLLEGQRCLSGHPHDVAHRHEIQTRIRAGAANATGGRGCVVGLVQGVISPRTLRVAIVENVKENPFHLRPVRRDGRLLRLRLRLRLVLRRQRLCVGVGQVRAAVR